MTHSEHLDEIAANLQALQSWAGVAAQINARIDDLTAQLVASNDEQTRGAIHALTDLLNYPETLEEQRRQATAALSEQSDAAI